MARLQAHRAATSPTTRTPRARCCSTSASSPGTPSSASCSASTRRSCPRRVPSAEVYGDRRREFGGEVPVAGIAGDQQAALFGQACLRPGMAKNTYGTGSFVLLNTGTEAPEPREGLLTTVAWGLEAETDYALEAAVFVTGAAVQWLRDGLGMIDEAAETEALAAWLDSNDGVYFVPALDRARLAALGSLRARGDRRPDAREPAAPSSRARRSRRSPTRRSTPCAPRRRRAGERARAAAGRRRRGRQPLADAVPGRRARRAGDRARDLGDDGARRRLPRGHRDGAVGPRARSRGCGARRRATSPRWAPTSASRCSPTGARAVERSRGWAND